MNLIVNNSGRALWKGQEFPCGIGRGGFVTAQAKTEGDGGTPIGSWGMREVFYRADRGGAPQTILPLRALHPDDGWCDAAQDANYNRFVKHPYPASAEHLWREDSVYDIIVVLGYNDTPAVSGKGSAIFLHLARPNYTPTAGCITLSRQDLLKVLREANPTSVVEVIPPSQPA